LPIGVYNENIVLTSTNATNVNVACSGSVTASEPTAQTTDLTFTNPTATYASTGFTINFTNAVSGAGTNHLVVVKALSDIDTDPTDGTSYSANTVFSSGTALGGGYVVYNGTGNAVVVTGLSKFTKYYVRVYDFNGSAGTENYYTTSPTSGNQTTLMGEITSNGVGGGTWSATTSWLGGTVPGQYDNVTIAAGDVIAVGSGAAAICNNLTIPATSKVWSPLGKTLQIYGTSLACAGTLGDALTTNSQLTVEFGGNLTISGAGGIYPFKIRPVTNITNIGITFDANVNVTGTGTTVMFDNVGNDNMYYTVNSPRTLNIAANFNTASSSATQSPSNNTLTINNGATVNVGGVLNTNELAGKTYTANINGTLAVTGTSTLSGTIDGGVATFNVNGTYTSTGNFIVTPSTAAVAPVINVGNTGTITVNGTADFSSTTLSGYIGNAPSTTGGTFTLASGGTIKLANVSGLEPVAGPIRTTTRNFSTGASYSYSGTAAQVAGSDLPTTVNGLTVNNAAGVTLGGSTTVNGILVLTAGTLTNTAGLTLGNLASIVRTAGSLSTVPVFGSTVNVTYNGATAQTTGNELPTATSVLSNLTINNAAGVTLAQSVTVNGILNLTSGIVATSTNVLTTGATATVSNASATSYVNGNLNKFIAASSTTKNFEIGDAAVYAPISIDFAGTVSNSTGTIQASTASGDHASISSSNFFADKTVNRTWTLTNGVALTGLTSYSPTFTFVSGDLDVSATTSNFVVGNYNSPTWTYPTVGTKTATSTQATGVTSFGSFAVGEALAASTITVTGTTSFTYSGSAQGPSSSTVTGSTGAITYSYVGVNATSYGPSTTAPTNTGTYTATASLAADANYLAATSDAFAFSIVLATPVVTPTVGTYTYSGSAQGPDAATNTGTGASYTFSYEGVSPTTYAASATAPTNAGTYTVTATVAANGNYGSASSVATAFTIATATATITATVGTYTYNGSGQGPTAVSGNTGSGTVTWSYVGTGSTSYAASASLPTAAGTYTATASVAANGNYGSASSSATAFTIDKATLTITANNQSKCAGATLSFAGTEFTTSTLLGSDAVSNVSLSSTGAGSGAAGGSYAIVASNATGTGLTNYTISYMDGSLTVSTSNTWTGAINNNWSNAGNWSCGVAPTTGAAISITSGNPVLDVDFIVSGSLTLSGAATLSINPLKTLSVSISGTANFGGKLVTVKSDNSGSGSIGQITGTLTGATNVTVERYIPANNFRSWRLLAAPTYGNGQTINQAWQEGNAALGNSTPGYGTQITSPTGTGFDGASLNPSMYRYNGTALEAVTNTGDAIATNQGYFLYVRGDRTVGMSSAITGSTATTLRTNGTLHQGTQTSETVLANNYGLVGNPFASAINFSSLQRTGGVTNAFYIWDAKKQSGNSLGMYQTFSETNAFVPTIDGGSYSTVDPNTTIQSGQAFFVYADATAGTVQIPESSKVASSGTLGYKNVSELVKIDSRLYSIAGTTTMADANVVVFDAAYSNAVDGNDAVKFSNGGENLGILKSGNTLAIEGRQPVITADTIFFKMWNMQAHAYQLELIPQNLGAQNLVARLEDSYLNTSTTVNLLDTTRVAFAVNATPASYASNRFRIVFTPTVVLPVNFISIAASRKATNVQVNWKVGNEVSIRQYEVERSTDGRNYTKSGTVAVTGNSAYGLLDANAPAGTLFYRIKSVGNAGEIKYSAVVKIAAENVKPGYAVVPNPIEGAEINIQFKNQTAGKYSIKLLNNAGQQISSTDVNHAGGNGTQTIQIPAGLARGAYQLEIISADKTSSTESIFINQ
jgi:hypothetical protein